MTINISPVKADELKPRIVVMGIGGGGGNAVNNMIASGLQGVEFVVANTDAQALALSRADRKVQMGNSITRGLGAGTDPIVGQESAEAALPEILDHLDGAHMLFIATGMGGGTGTGAAPVIAKAARERDILTVAIATKPFNYEGRQRMKIAEQGLADLAEHVDTLIVIPNQNLFRVSNQSTTYAEAFNMADQVLSDGIKGVTDLMVNPGVLNLDFADVRTVMGEMGKAMMGTGEATGDDRARKAAEDAIANPLLDDVSLQGAKGLLVNIAGGTDMTFFEVEEAANLITEQVDPDAITKIGTAIDPALEGFIRISVVATGVHTAQSDIQIAEASRYVDTDPVEPEIADDPFAIEDEDDFTTLRPAAADEAPAPALQPSLAPAAKVPPAPDAPQPYRYERPAAGTLNLTKDDIAPVLPSEEPRTVVKPLWGFFNRGKTDAKPAGRPPVKTSQPKNGDLFGSPSEDELEIPAFLRQ